MFITNNVSNNILLIFVYKLHVIYYEVLMDDKDIEINAQDGKMLKKQNNFLVFSHAKLSTLFHC